MVFGLLGISAMVLAILFALSLILAVFIWALFSSPEDYKNKSIMRMSGKELIENFKKNVGIE